ncbi:type I secretion system permease/ATPase [Faunimonas sp. B44]|uniref:type I secretion system permease/ATPase n=1 Tax=Faunimonas sp. B44 TaxID=3461493 RepID=UPI0040439DEC
MFQKVRLGFLRRGFIEIGIFSCLVNVLLLVVPLYLLQVYDRILPSSSLETLAYLSIAALGSLIVLGILEMVRGQYANRLAARVDLELGSTALISSLRGSRAAYGDVQPLRDLATVRSFSSSRVLFFLFDVPFTPLFLAVLYLVHPLLFEITAAGAVLLLLVAVVNQLATARAGAAAAETLARSMNTAQAFARNYETLKALGMLRNVTDFWGRRFADALSATDRLTRVNAAYSGVSRMLRMILQIVILGFGAYLVLGGEMTGGMIFAATILSTRALQPLDQIIGAWRQIIDTRAAWRRLRDAVRAAEAAEGDSTDLPAPAGALAVEDLIYFLPDSDAGAPPLIKRVSFTVEPRGSLAIVGPSRAGKSTLARLIVGALEPRSGTVRLDGASIRNWESDALGQYFGYLAQDVELLPGTIAENISRFDPDASGEAVIEAARRAHCHELILAHKDGYATQIGPGGVRLSGGERQRIGLARALFGDPRLLVLDEPNANLDGEGEAALESAIKEACDRNVTVLLITHKVSLAARCERILYLRDGRVEIVGPASEVIQKISRAGLKPYAVRPEDGQARGPAGADAEHGAQAPSVAALRASAG